MLISRRGFLKLIGAALAAGQVEGCSGLEAGDGQGNGVCGYGRDRCRDGLRDATGSKPGKVIRPGRVAAMDERAVSKPDDAGRGRWRTWSGAHDDVIETARDRTANVYRLNQE